MRLVERRTLLAARRALLLVVLVESLAKRT